MPLTALSVTGNESAAVVPAAPSATLAAPTETVGGGSLSMIVRVRAGGSNAPPDAVPDTVTLSSASSRASSDAATVTVPVLAVSPAAMVSIVAADRVKSPTTAGGTAVTITVTATAAAAAGLIVAVIMASPPPSVTDARDAASVTCGKPSSSTTASVTADGSATPWPPSAVPDTATSTATLPPGSSRALSFAVTVTVPVLLVSPAAMVSVVAVLTLKSPACAPDDATAAADTVTVTGSLDGCESAAVTVATPPFSAIDAGDAESDTVGRLSSSVNVSAAPVTVTVCESAAAWSFDAEPVTVVERTAAPSSTSLSTATIVATSEAFAVSPASITTVASGPAVYAPATPVTVTVVAALDGRDSVAVTVAVPPFSEIDDGDTASVTIGGASSSLIVSVTATGSATLPPEAVPETVTLLSGACSSSSFAETVTVPVLVVTPGAMVSTVSPLSVKSPLTAFAPAAADTVIRTAVLAARLRLAVTVATPPFSAIDAGSSVNAASGTASSSLMVSVASDGSVIPWALDAEPDTVTDLVAACTLLSTAVIVTVPVLVVDPAATVSSVPVCEKSPAAAGGTADAVTVTADAALDRCESVAVTVATVFAPLSSMPDGVSDSVTAGVGSSSSIVAVAVSAVCPATTASVAFPGSLNDRTTVSSSSSRVSPFAFASMVPPFVVPAAMVSVPAVSAT